MRLLEKECILENTLSSPALTDHVVARKHIKESGSWIKRHYNRLKIKINIMTFPVFLKFKFLSFKAYTPDSPRFVLFYLFLNFVLIVRLTEKWQKM